LVIDDYYFERSAHFLVRKETGAVYFDKTISASDYRFPFSYSPKIRDIHLPQTN
jgi:hypothetical protein